MASRIASKTQPEWLKKIAREHEKAENRALNGRIKLVELKSEVQHQIDQLNRKYKTRFKIEDFFSISPDEEEYVMDMMEGWTDDE